MVVFHTMDLILTLCQRINKHVVIEKHYSQMFGNRESKRLINTKCRYSGDCRDLDCEHRCICSFAETASGMQYRQQDKDNHIIGLKLKCFGPFLLKAMIAPFAATGAILSGIEAGARALGVQDFPLWVLPAYFFRPTTFAFEKRLDFCGECPEYPCEDLRLFRKCGTTSSCM